MLVGALVVFLLVLILSMFGRHVYARWKWERQRREVELYSHEAYEQKAAARKGLDRAMVDALPTFIYDTDTIKSLKASEGRLDQAGMECPVCLCEFQHNEKGRLLPKCSHRFHADCIDTWLLSNPSCPVCRASAGPEMEVSSVRDELRGSGINVHICDDSNISAGTQFPTNVLLLGQQFSCHFTRELGSSSKPHHTNPHTARSDPPSLVFFFYRPTPRLSFNANPSIAFIEKTPQ